MCSMDNIYYTSDKCHPNRGLARWTFEGVRALCFDRWNYRCYRCRWISIVCDHKTSLRIQLLKIPSLYIIPGSAALLCRVCLGGDNLLLVYADHRARLWDVKTQEFWRSMSLEKVDELLDQGGWMDLYVASFFW